MEVRYLLVAALLAFGSLSVAAATGTPSTISAVGVTLRVPAGWHAAVAKTPDCDPERLIVISSARLKISASGRVASPAPGQVVILLLEDRYVQDRPTGNLRRPVHFTIAWNRLVKLEPSGYCGSPAAPAAMHYFKTHGRYLGFIVYPGAGIRSSIRAKTLSVMDSLRVSN
jgi:hypothetical protein